MELLPLLDDTFAALIQFDRMAYLLLGVLLGLLFGAMPGLGGISGLSILLVFTFDMEPTAAVAMVIGLMVATTTADTLPAVMFAVPGTGSAQAIILDGYPLAQKGEAARALGAAYLASALGGIIGAVVLMVSLSWIRSYILLFASPELFMLALLGVVITGALVGSNPLRGVIMGGIGLMLGTIGFSTRAGIQRYTFDSLYLADGVAIVLVALGMFAIPEIVDQLIRGRAIAKESSLRGSVLQGMRDTLRNWFLVVRTSMIGIGLGAVPGLGGSVIDWISYAHARNTSKDGYATFGSGDIRGVIGVDAATNSKEGGSLIPTLAFGIPGSPAYALVLVVLLMHGITIGPDILTTRADIFLTIVWTLVIGNVAATVIMLGVSRPLGRIVHLPFYWIAPVLLVTIMFAAYQVTNAFFDMFVMLGIGVFGWVMKRAGWPRPPLIIGFVLSPLMERYLFLALNRFGMTWLTRPVVMGLGLLMLALIARPLITGIARRVLAGRS